MGGTRRDGTQKDCAGFLAAVRYTPAGAQKAVYFDDALLLNTRLLRDQRIARSMAQSTEYCSGDHARLQNRFQCPSTHERNSEGPGEHHPCLLALIRVVAPGISAAILIGTIPYIACPSPHMQVIIELCSKHLDTECGGPDATSTSTSTSTPTSDPSNPPSGTPDRPGSAEPLPRANPSSATTSKVALISDRSPPHHQPARATATSGLASTPDVKGERKKSGGSRTASPSTAAVKAAFRAMDPSSEPVNPASNEAGVGQKGSSRTPARSLLASSPASRAPVPAPSPARAAASAIKPATSRRRKNARGAPGRKGPAAPTATGAADKDAEALIPCPVCGEHVRADLCSRHLDTDCAGATPAADGKGAGAVGDDGEEGAGGKGSGGGAGAKKKDGGSEAQGGLNALAAELTCPVW